MHKNSSTVRLSSVFHYSLPEYLSINMERIQKGAMHIIHGYDTPYEQALATSGIPNVDMNFVPPFSTKLLCNKKNNYISFYSQESLKIK